MGFWIASAFPLGVACAGRWVSVPPPAEYRSPTAFVAGVENILPDMAKTAPTTPAPKRTGTTRLDMMNCTRWEKMNRSSEAGQISGLSVRVSRRLRKE